MRQIHYLTAPSVKHLLDVTSSGEPTNTQAMKKRYFFIGICVKNWVIYDAQKIKNTSFRTVAVYKTTCSVFSNTIATLQPLCHFLIKLFWM